MPETRLPAKAYYVILALWIGVVVVLAFVAGVQAAGLVLAVSLIVLAALRLMLPEGLIPVVRSGLVDVGTLLLLAAILAYFSLWGDAPALN